MTQSTQKKTSKAQKTRETILDSALKLFSEKGYANTSMRDIAKKANVAVGGAYYYFRTKDEMILEVYSRSQKDAELRNGPVCDQTKKFRDRFLDLIFYRLGILAEQRELFVILTQTGVNPSNPLSPFSREAEPLREAAIKLIDKALQGSDLKVSGLLRPILPRLLWFYQMSVILFWSLDGSKEQYRTRRLVEVSLDLMIPLLKMSMLPLAGIFNKRVVEIHDLLKTMIRENPEPVTTEGMERAN